jgi:hypothetical protein
LRIFGSSGSGFEAELTSYGVHFRQPWIR